MNIISESVSLLRVALGEKNSLEYAKAASKKIDELNRRILELPFPPSEAFLNNLENLIDLDQQVLQLKNKYGSKIHSRLLSIMDRKALWISQTHFNSHCKKMYFAGEDKGRQSPFILPPHTLELLKAHSNLIQANWEHYKNSTEANFDQLSRNIFLMMIEHLTTGQIENVPVNDIVTLYQAANFLDIPALKNKYVALLRDSLPLQTHTGLLEILCNSAIGRIPCKEIPQAAFSVFLELEARHAFNCDYFKQPNNLQYIQSFCAKEGLSLNRFKTLAEKNGPYFFDYLNGMSGKIERRGFEHLTRLALAVSCYKSNLKTPAATEELAKAFGGQMNYLVDPTSVTKEFERELPSLWIQKQVCALLTAKSLDDYEKTLGEISSLRRLKGAAFTEKLDKICHIMAFECHLELYNDQEATASAQHFTLTDFPQEIDFKNYHSFLLERGFFRRYLHEFRYDPVLCQTNVSLYMMRFAKASNQSQTLNEICQILFGRWPHNSGTLLFQGIPINPQNLIGDLIKHCLEKRKFVLPRIFLAYLYWKAGENDLALSMCSEVLALQENPAILHLRGQLYSWKGEYALAQKDLFDSLKDDLSYSNITSYVHFLVKAYGAETAHHYVDQLQSFPLAKTIKGSLFLLENRLDEAMALLHEIPEELKNTPEYFHFQACIAEFKNDANTAFHYISKALSKTPESLCIALDAARICEKRPIWAQNKVSMKLYFEVCQKIDEHPEWQQQNHLNRPVPQMTALNSLLTGKSLPNIHFEGHGWLHLFKALHGNPSLVRQEVEIVKPFLSHNWAILQPYFVAHRLGEFNKVIELSYRNDSQEPIKEVLVADALRRIGQLTAARAIIDKISKQHPYSALKIVEAAILFDRGGTENIARAKVMLKDAINQGCIYYPLLELAYVTLARISRSEPELRDKYLSELELLQLIKSPESFLLREELGGRKRGSHEIIHFKKQGYSSDCLNVALYDALERENAHANARDNKVPRT